MVLWRTIYCVENCLVAHLRLRWLERMEWEKAAAEQHYTKEGEGALWSSSEFGGMTE